MGGVAQAPRTIAPERTAETTIRLLFFIGFPLLSRLGLNLTPPSGTGRDIGIISLWVIAVVPELGWCRSWLCWRQDILDRWCDVDGWRWRNINGRRHINGRWNINGRLNDIGRWPVVRKLNAHHDARRSTGRGNTQGQTCAGQKDRNLAKHTNTIFHGGYPVPNRDRTNNVTLDRTHRNRRSQTSCPPLHDLARVAQFWP